MVQASRQPLPSDRRSRGRVLISRDVQCNLGGVLDLSANGMRLVARSPMEGLVRVCLTCPSVQAEVAARVIWVQKQSRSQYLHGLQFLEVSRPTASALTQIASEYRLSRAA